MLGCLLAGARLQLLWDRKGLACAVRPDAGSVERARWDWEMVSGKSQPRSDSDARSLTDLEDVDSSDLLLVAQALAVAGFVKQRRSQT